MIEYHKIETLFHRDEQTFKIKEPYVLKNKIYGELKHWDCFEKIDGTNIRVFWDCNAKKIHVMGRTNNAQISGDLVRYMYDSVNPAFFNEYFPETTCTIFGEGYGAGIQSGGGYSREKRFAIFDVLVDEQWWLNREHVEQAAERLLLPTVPYLGCFPLETVIELARNGFKSGVEGATCQAEGIIGKPIENLFDKRGNRVILKLKTKDFAEKTSCPNSACLEKPTATQLLQTQLTRNLPNVSSLPGLA